MGKNGGGTVHVTKGSELQTSGGQTEGMIRMNAITGLSEQICGTLMIAKPKSASDIHHHGEEDTIIYAASGEGTVVSNGGRTRQDLKQGDWALIPAFTEHQEVNESDSDVVWVITRGGKNPVVQNLTEWGGQNKD